MLNRNLAKYIEIVIKQRARAKAQLADQFGTDSPAVSAAETELAELETYALKLKTYGNETVTVDGEPVMPAAQSDKK